MKTKKLESIIWDIYRVLYKNSTPPAEFDELVEHAPINELGQKVINFMAYSIDEKLFEELMEAEIKKHKVPKWQQQVIRSTVYLGCSPKCNYEQTNRPD